MHLSKIISTKRLLVILLLVLLVIGVALDVLEASFLIRKPERILVLVDDLIVRLDKLGFPPKLVSSLASSKLNVAPPALGTMAALTTAGLLNNLSCIYSKVYLAHLLRVMCPLSAKSRHGRTKTSTLSESIQDSINPVHSGLKPTRTHSSSLALHSRLTKSSSS